MVLTRTPSPRRIPAATELRTAFIKVLVTQGLCGGTRAERPCGGTLSSDPGRCGGTRHRERNRLRGGNLHSQDAWDANNEAL